MKVLMQSRKNFYTLRGGDTVQFLKTKSELEKLGVEVDICLDYEPDLSNYDLVHLSNVTRIQETYLHVLNAKKQNKPIALSTIYWPMDEFEKKGQVGIRKIINSVLSIDEEEKVKAVARYMRDRQSRDIATKNLWKIGYTRMQEFVVNNVDYYLPNSEMEMDMLCKSFGIPKHNYTVVPNAIDSDLALKLDGMQDDLKFEKYRDAIICVGRIEPRKNQLALVKALDGTDYTLVLVGAVSDNQRKYFNEIKKYIDRNSTFYYIPQIKQEELYQLFKMCKVSTLPSWLDTPGLVSLEAAVMGCNLAISSKGSTTEYFEDYADYCVPDDIPSIKAAIDRAYAKARDNNLRTKILEEYTWKNAAEATLCGYRKLLKES